MLAHDHASASLHLHEQLPSNHKEACTCLSSQLIWYYRCNTKLTLRPPLAPVQSVSAKMAADHLSQTWQPPITTRYMHVQSGQNPFLKGRRMSSVMDICTGLVLSSCTVALIALYMDAQTGEQHTSSSECGFSHEFLVFAE